MLTCFFLKVRQELFPRVKQELYLRVQSYVILCIIRSSTQCHIDFHHKGKCTEDFLVKKLGCFSFLQTSVFVELFCSKLNNNFTATLHFTNVMDTNTTTRGNKCRMQTWDKSNCRRMELQSDRKVDHPGCLLYSSSK